jgi:hypothetical protein
MLVQELDKPIQERYLHSIVSHDNRMHLIFIFVPSLLKLIHDSPVGEGDIQYKHVENLFNEYEFVTYLPDIQHSESESIFTILRCSLSDWWTHKIQSPWILPCILKSESFILPEHWDTMPATTNTGEAQHHWTNKQSGIKLSLVEAIELYVLSCHIML